MPSDSPSAARLMGCFEFGPSGFSKYVGRFLQARNIELKAKAEAQQWHNS
jgi:hypothetical protein